MRVLKTLHFIRNSLRRNAFTFACALGAFAFENSAVYAKPSLGLAEIPETAKNTTGSAADLAGIPPVGWPLGVPMTCHALTEQVNDELRSAAERLRKHCNEKNLKMRADGYETCAVDQCIDYVVVRGGGYDHGKFAVNLGRNIYTGDPQLTITYTYPLSSKANGNSLVCFDPTERSQQVLADEFSAWDFRKFAEFCATRADPISN